MLLFVFPPYAQMGSELATSLGLRLGHLTIDRFPNQEVHAAIESNVVNEECLILGDDCSTR
jgi:phosphoribosylpyrophosphate synthetase